MSLIRSVGINFVVRNVGQYKAAIATVRQQTSFLSAMGLRLGTSFGSASAGASTFGAALTAPQRAVMALGMGIRNLGHNLKSLGNETAAVGFRLGFLLSLPILSAAAAMSNAAVDFETELAKIISIVGESQQKVREWGDEIINLAPRVGQAPKDLANTLFFLTSAGIRDTVEAMDLLETSAKLTAIGLGDTKLVARLLTGVIQTYGRENISAAQAGDILIATVREGNLEAHKLAPTLGRVIGVAAELGASFGELSAFISAFTRSGVPVEVAVTSLRGVMTNLLKPTGDARKALAEIGMTVQDVRDSIADPGVGLAKTLVNLRNALGTIDEGVPRVFGNVRALAGLLFNTAEEFQDSYLHIENVITNAEGMTDRAFAVVSQTVGFQLEQLKAEFAATATVIGTLFLPALSSLVSYTRPVVAALAELARINPALFKMAAGFAIVAALGAPLLIFFGLLISSLGSIVGIIGGVIATFGLLFTPVGALIGVITVLAGLFAVSLPKTAAKTGLEFTKLNAIVDRVRNGFQTFMEKTREASARQAEQFAQDSVFIQHSVDQLGQAIADTTSQAATDLVTNLTAAGQAVPDIFENVAADSSAALYSIPNAMRDASALTAAQMEGMTRDMYDSASQIPDIFTAVGEDTKNIVDKEFGEVANESRSWGRNIVIQFARGIAEATIAVVKALTHVGMVIRRWLRPGSPPALLPDLDKWGAGALSAYMEGWKDGDFSVFNDIASIIERNLRSLTEGLLSREDLIPNILDARNIIAEIINEFNEFGTIATSSLDSIATSFGPLGVKVREYIATMLELKTAQQDVKDAQEALNKVQLKFAAQLKPLDRELREIDKFAQSVRDAQRVGELQAILRDPRAPKLAKELATAELRQIKLQQERALIEELRDAEIEEAETVLSAAQAKEDALKQQVVVLEAFIDAQLKNNELLAQQIALLESLAETLKDVSEAVGAALKGATGATSFGDIGDLWDEDWDGVLPPLGDIAGDDLLKSIKEIGDGFGDLIEEIKGEFGGLGEAFDTMTDVWSDNFAIIYRRLVATRNWLQNDLPVAAAAMKKGLIDRVTEIRDGLIDRFNEMRDTVTDRFNEMRDRAKTALQPLVDFLTRVFAPLAEPAGELWDAVVGLIGDLGKLFGVLRPLLPFIREVWKSIGAVIVLAMQNGMDTLRYIWGYFKVVLAAGAVLFGAFLAGMIGAITGLINGVRFIVQTFTVVIDMFRGYWEMFLEGLAGFIRAFVDKDLALLWKSIGKMVWGLLGTLAGVLVALVGALVVGVVAMVLATYAFFVGAYGYLKGWSDETKELVKTWARVTYWQFRKWVKDTMEPVEQWVEDTAQAISDWVNDTVEDIAQWAVDTWNTIDTWVKDTIKRVIEWSDDLDKKISEWATDTWGTIDTWVKDTIKRIEEWSDDLNEKITTWITDFSKRFQDMGSAMLKSLVDALTNAETWAGLLTAMLSLVGGIGDALKGWWSGLWGGLSVPDVSDFTGGSNRVASPMVSGQPVVAPGVRGPTGNSVNIGPNHINNGMDMHEFEARVGRAVRTTIT